jgi:hypothetical protein
MIQAIFPGCGRTLACAAAAGMLLSTGGCAIKQAMYADEQIEPYVRSLPKRHDYPLARTLTWKFYYVEGRKRPELSYFIADGNLIRDKSSMDKLQIYAAQPVTSGVNMSEVYAQRARDATKRGDHKGAQIYHGLSQASLQSRIAAERTQAGLALAGALIMPTAALLADMGMVRYSQGVAAYVKDDRAPLIGDGAPEGTVLELFLRRELLRDAEAKPTDLLQTYETVATLKDANGNIWRSVASFRTHYFLGMGSGPLPVPEQYKNRPYVLLRDTTSALPAGNESYAVEEAELARIRSRSTFVELGITAARAIDDLYEQLEFAKSKR